MRHLLSLLPLGMAICIQAQETRIVRLDSLDLKSVAQGWGSPQKNRSVDKHPLSIGGRKFEHGFGTHADSKVTMDLDGAVGTFSAFVGVDDEVGDKGTVNFKIVGDK